MSTNKKVLSVRTKILFAVIASIAALSAVIYLISTMVLLPSYAAIERASVAQDLRRATDAIEEFSNQQMIKLSDWAAWDEAYKYARDRDAAWVEETVYATGLANLDINALMFTDPEGNLIFLKAVDIRAREEVPAEDVERYFGEHRDLITFDGIEGETQGIAMLPQGPLITVSLPLRTSEGLGPSTGALTFARYLDADKIAELSEVTHLAISVFEYRSASLPPDVVSARSALDAGSPTVIVPETAEKIAGYTLMRDLYGNPALIIRIDSPRPVYAQGSSAFALYMLVGGIALLLFGGVMLLLIERLVVARFVRLTEEVDGINDDRDLSRRVEGGVMDEIGRLAEQINRMLLWLSEAREGEAKARREMVNLVNDLNKEKEQVEEFRKLRGEK